MTIKNESKLNEEEDISILHCSIAVLLTMDPFLLCTVACLVFICLTEREREYILAMTFAEWGSLSVLTPLLIMSAPLFIDLYCTHHTWFFHFQ